MEVTDKEIESISRLLRSSNQSDRELASTFIALYDFSTIKRLIESFVEPYARILKQSSIISMLEILIKFENAYEINLYIEKEKTCISTQVFFTKRTHEPCSVWFSYKINKKRNTFRRHGNNFEKRLRKIIKIT